MDDEKHRIVIGTGIDLDKRELYELSKSMALDRDIRKISLLGPVLWNLFVLGVLTGTIAVLVSSFSTLTSVGAWGVRLVSSLSLARLRSAGFFLLRNGLPVGIGIYISSILSKNLYHRLRVSFVDDLLSTFRDLPENIAKSLVILKTDTWQNSNYWHTFTSGQSDRDPLVILSNSENDDSVSGIYSDEPYYRNVFVDSVYVGFDGPTGLSSLGLRWFDRRLKLFRIVSLAVLSVPALLFLVHSWIFPIPSMPVLGEAWIPVGAACNALFLAIVVTTVFTRYSRFHAEFYGNSAGSENYERLLNKDPQKALIEDKKRYEDTTLLGNSLAGYGVFYLSEFLRNVVSQKAGYEVSLSASEGDREVLWAGEQVLRSSTPGRTEQTREPPGITVNLHGVKYFTVDEPENQGILARLRYFFGDNKADKEMGHKRVEGNKKGIRLPVKKYVSVPTDIYGEQDLSHPSNPSSFPFFFHESWEDDTTHYLLLGGAEHQQALVKFVRHLKSEGYGNIDLLENTFAEEDSLKFVSEYFVSSVLGDENEEVFRGKESFVFLSHQFSENKYIHVLQGHQAVATKVGFLYWFEELYPKFDSFCEGEPVERDILYNIEYEASDDFEVGDYYVDASWMNTEEDERLSFEWLGWIDDDDAQTVERAKNRIGCKTAKVRVVENDDR